MVIPAAAAAATAAFAFIKS
ncbi:hypothetical protein YPPY25_3507, partial [Yersinia pestis PY-25]